MHSLCSTDVRRALTSLILDHTGLWIPNFNVVNSVIATVFWDGFTAWWYGRSEIQL